MFKPKRFRRFFIFLFSDFTELYQIYITFSIFIFVISKKL